MTLSLSSAKRNCLEDHDKQRQTHRQPWKQVMKGGSEREMDTVNRQGILMASEYTFSIS